MDLRLPSLKQLVTRDRRGKSRQRIAGIVAHYWDGSTAHPREVKDISAHGCYLCTDERWYPKTVLRITLESIRHLKGEIPHGKERRRQIAPAVAVLGRVIRSGADGVGIEFIFPEDRGAMWNAYAPQGAADRHELKSFLDAAKAEGMQVLVLIEKDVAGRS